jgi:beta-galactosidase
VPDRAIGKVGRYFGKVEDQLTDYIKPQECGGRVGIRWFELRNNQNRGLRIELDKPRMVTVLPLTSIALADATHNVYLKRSGATVVTIDAAHRGVGTASCGPDTLAELQDPAQASINSPGLLVLFKPIKERVLG